MTNPYTGIITAELKATFNNLIDALLEPDACTVPCEIIYGGQRFVNCTNCNGTGIYQPGGSIPFPNGQICPLCRGTNKIESIETEEVDLMCIFDSKKWKNLVVSPETFDKYAQTMCHLTLYPKLKAAKHIILDSTNKLYMRNVYKRMGEPEPLGFGDMRYILTSWERVN